MNRNRLAAFFFAAFAVNAPSLSAQESPLARHYRDGEVLRYGIDGEHAENGAVNHRYHAEAAVLVKKDPDGVFHEEFQWDAVKKDGVDAALPPGGADFRQMLSLDPAFKVSVPDLSNIGAILSGPITDTLTFYVDDRLALSRPALRRAGDRAHIPYGRPSSWAHGRVLTGYDCIDFDVAIAAVDAAAGTAVIDVRHGPTPRICGQVPAEWMRTRVSDTENNWFQVEKTEDGLYAAGAGKETFDARIEILLPSGIIRSATMHNPVQIEQRTCKDAALSDCGPIEKVEIVRTIKFSLEQDPQ